MTLARYSVFDGSILYNNDESSLDRVSFANLGETYRHVHYGPVTYDLLAVTDNIEKKIYFGEEALEFIFEGSADY